MIGNGHASDNNFKFAVISDHRDDLPGLQNALSFIAAQQVDFIIVPGDYSSLRETYNNGYAEMGFVVSSEKESNMQDVYYILGNHDDPASGSNFFQKMIAPYYPDNGPDDAHRGTIYSFDRGNAHFVATNQYWNYRSGGYTDAQLSWLKRDLHSSQQYFKFVIGHEPAYPMDRHVGNSLDADPEMRDRFWNILADNGVSAFLCGHTHHLSVIKNRGVYQINAGQVESNHISVVIVEINDTSAIVRLYETRGTTPEAADNPFDASLEEANTGDQGYEVVFSSSITHPDNPSTGGCFVQSSLH